METPTGNAERERRLLDEFSTYDEHVDVVSAMEWLFTDPTVKKMPDTVRHFERFPRLDQNGKCTPDFTVLFTDRTAIVGEISSLAIHDNSADKLCGQIGRYAELTQVQDGSGHLVDVDHLDVLQLVPARIGLRAIQRIIRDRYLDPKHSYKPPRAPCIVQYSRTDGDYSFQRLPDPDNGTLTRTARDPNLVDYIDNDLNVNASHFVATKARRAFINDPVQRLYMATHLWVRTWPTKFGASAGEVEVTVSGTANELRKYYGVGRTGEVKQALQLLEAAGLARDEGQGRWTIALKLLGRSGDRDVHRLIAHRAVHGARPLLRRRSQSGTSTPSDDVLF